MPMATAFVYFVASYPLFCLMTQPGFRLSTLAAHIPSFDHAMMSVNFRGTIRKGGLSKTVSGPTRPHLVIRGELCAAPASRTCARSGSRDCSDATGDRR